MVELFTKDSLCFLWSNFGLIILEIMRGSNLSRHEKQVGRWGLFHVGPLEYINHDGRNSVSHVNASLSVLKD